jgi:hypothetical protein
MYLISLWCFLKIDSNFAQYTNKLMGAIRFAQRQLRELNQLNYIILVH